MDTRFVNNSGLGKNTEVNELISKNFNYGACLLTWIWGVFNKTYITLIFIPICLLPSIVAIIISGILSIYFGIKGNTWAWQNKHWESIEHFHSVQKKWAIAGLIPIFIILIVGTIMIAFLKYDMYSLKHPKGDFQKIYYQIIKCKEQAKNAMDKINEDNINCGETSEELAKCFSKYLDIKSITKNVLVLGNSSTWNFYGQDASLYSKYTQDLGYNYIRIDVNGKDKPNREIDIIKIPLITDKNGKLLGDESIKKTLGGFVLQEK